MRKKKYKYTLQIRGVARVLEKVIEADEDEIRDGIIYFYNDNLWEYAVSISSLIDMKVQLIEKDTKKGLTLEEFPNSSNFNGKLEGDVVSTHDKHVETVLPKEHQNG